MASYFTQNKMQKLPSEGHRISGYSNAFLSLSPAILPIAPAFVLFLPFWLFFGCVCSMWKFLGQGTKLRAVTVLDASPAVSQGNSLGLSSKHPLWL